MPFTKVGKNDYKSPSGRHFNGKQVALYYATGGFKHKPGAKAKNGMTHGKLGK